jgi:hypothetical protein
LGGYDPKVASSIVALVAVDMVYNHPGRRIHDNAMEKADLAADATSNVAVGPYAPASRSNDGGVALVILSTLRELAPALLADSIAWSQRRD